MVVKRQSFKRIGKRKRRRRRIWKRKVRVVIQEQREVLIIQSKKGGQGVGCVLLTILHLQESSLIDTHGKWNGINIYSSELFLLAQGFWTRMWGNRTQMQTTWLQVYVFLSSLSVTHCLPR